MIAMFLLLGAETIYLPNYSLGQPLEEARAVVPNARTRETWHLRCAGESGAPAGLALTGAERAAGVRRCWPMERIDGTEQRSAVSRRQGQCAVQEVEFLDDRIVRIKTDRCDIVPGGKSSIWSHPQASVIDRLNDRPR